MIGLEMKMPENCMGCICCYQIRTGKDVGKDMCIAMQEIDPKKRTEECIVDAWAEGRPANCPMREITVEYDPT